MFQLDLDFVNVIQRAIKYLVEGLAVAIAAYYIPSKKMNLQEIAVIALTAAASLAILDLLAPAVGSGARHGAGFGIGASMVGVNRFIGAPQASM
jgi:ABC-type Co2+ transport system permease subunit